MTCPPEARPFVVLLLAAMKGLTLTRIGDRIGMSGKKVSYELTKAPNISDGMFERLLLGVRATPGDVATAMTCYEALVSDPSLSSEERDVVETEVREAARWYRAILVQAVPLSRAVPPLDEYPQAADLEPARWLAMVKLAYLKGVDQANRLPVVKASRELQSWAVCELIAEEAVQAASRDLNEAFHWARLAGAPRAGEVSRLSEVVVDAVVLSARSLRASSTARLAAALGALVVTLPYAQDAHAARSLT